MCPASAHATYPINRFKKQTCQEFWCLKKWVYHLTTFSPAETSGNDLLILMLQVIELWTYHTASNFKITLLKHIYQGIVSLFCPLYLTYDHYVSEYSYYCCLHNDTVSFSKSYNLQLQTFISSLNSFCVSFNRKVTLCFVFFAYVN